MRKTVTQEIDLTPMLDILAEVYEQPWQNFTEQQAEEAFDSLSESTKSIAYQWTTSDTVFRDAAYSELLKRKQRNA